MTKAVVRPRARADLKQIARRSEQEWGVDRAKYYIRTINTAIQRLSALPESGSDGSHLKSDYRKWPVGAHTIFYRRTAAGIDVIRILHQRMDISRHLD